MQEHTTPNLLESAVSAHKAGDYVHAEELYRQVIDISPNNLDALHYLALIFISTDHPEIAIPLLTKAISIKGDDPDILYNLALAHQKAQEIESAIYFYKLAIALKPDFALAYNNIGVAYQHTGNLTEADAHLEKAFSIDTGCIDAHYNFSQSHKFTPNDHNYILKLEELLNRGGWNKNEEIKLNFSLGKIHDDLAKYEVAFKYYSKGNSLKNQGFNIDQFKHYIDQVIENYNSDLINKLKQDETNNLSAKFIFIVGMPRSGTTLVEQIIARHSTTNSAGEIGFIGEIVDELPQLIQSKDTYPSCIKSMKTDSIIEISNAVYKQIDKLKIPHTNITDKSPTNFLHLGLIQILFPNSIIIHCNRNAIDTSLSCFFQNFEKQQQYTYDLKTLAFFHNEYSRLMQHWETVLENKIFNISYEKLVSNQEDESKKLISACGLDWEEKCLSFYDSKAVVSTASKWQVRRPIYKTSVGKWKNYEPYINDLISNLKIRNQ